MSHWFDITFDSIEANLLKKAVRILDQIARIDQDDLPDSVLHTNPIPNFAELQLSPSTITLISRNSIYRPGGMTSALVMDPLVFGFSKKTRKLYISLQKLHRLLEYVTGEDSITLFGDDEVDDLIFVEIGDVISWRDEIQTEVGFQRFDYPMRVGLSSERFLGLILNLEAYGFKVHARVSATQVVFRVGNNEMEYSVKSGEPMVIESDGGTYPFAVKFDLLHKSAFLNASILSDMVWMFTSAAESTTLSFSIEGLGDLIVRPTDYTLYMAPS